MNIPTQREELDRKVSEEIHDILELFVQGLLTANEAYEKAISIWNCVSGLIPEETSLLIGEACQELKTQCKRRPSFKVFSKNDKYRFVIKNQDELRITVCMLAEENVQHFPQQETKTDLAKIEKKILKFLADNQWTEL